MGFITLKEERKNGKGDITFSREFLVDASSLKPGELMRIEDLENGFEYRHPECYWGRFRNPEDREEKFSRDADEVLSCLRQTFPESYIKRKILYQRDSLYGDTKCLEAVYYAPKKFLGKIWPDKLATLWLDMMSADLECHNERAFETLDKLLRDRKENSLKTIPFFKNAELRKTSY